MGRSSTSTLRWTRQAGLSRSRWGFLRVASCVRACWSRRDSGRRRLIHYQTHAGFGIVRGMKRRAFLRGMATAPLVASPFIEIVSAQAPPQRGRGGPAGAATTPPYPAPPAKPRQKIKQSVMGSVWTGLNNSFEDRCKILQQIGFKGVDLPNAQQAQTMKQYGLTPTMMTGTGTTMQNGFMRKELHDAQETACRAGIDTCVAAGCANLIGFAGEKRGMSPQEAADNTVAIFTRLKPYAEEKNVNICLEITNSKVVADQRVDMAFNHVAWG